MTKKELLVTLVDNVGLLTARLNDLDRRVENLKIEMGTHGHGWQNQTLNKLAVQLDRIETAVNEYPRGSFDGKPPAA